MRSAFLHSLNYDLTPTLQIVGLVMFGAWALAYVQILAAGFRQKTYGLPLACIFLNISWEFIFSFNLVAPAEYSLMWGNRLWFFADCVIVTQVFLYGRQSQANPWVREHFYKISIASLVASLVGLYTFAVYFNDIYGLAMSFLINFVLSLLFIPLLFSRPDLKGLPYSAAWTKMIGSVAGAVFCYLWWPMQFDQTGTLVRPPYTPQPPSSYLLYFLYLSIFVLDLTYIHLYRQRLKALRAEAAG
jgi:uncharacterized membrane protein YpjA